MTIHEMKFANCFIDGAPVLAVANDSKLYDFTAGLKAAQMGSVATTDEILKREFPAERLAAAFRAAISEAPLVGKVIFRPCVIEPQKIVMVGLNYRMHALETKSPIPEVPLLFSKFNNALAAHEQVIRLPVDQDKYFDYEAELVIVVGRTARNVSESEALQYVFGYSVGNDLSARGLQIRTSQMLLGKSLDGFAPLGPFLVGKSAVSDPDKLKIECAVNGQVRQSSTTGDMIFSCRQLISYISRYITLLPGDIIYTGTPGGVAAGFPKGTQPWLVPGDKVDVSIQGLGTLSNTLS